MCACFRQVEEGKKGGVQMTQKKKKKPHAYFPFFFKKKIVFGICLFYCCHIYIYLFILYVIEWWATECQVFPITLRRWELYPHRIDFPPPKILTEQGVTCQDAKTESSIPSRAWQVGNSNPSAGTIYIGLGIFFFWHCSHHLPRLVSLKLESRRFACATVGVLVGCRSRTRELRN